MSFKECWIGCKAPKIQRSSCTPRWYCKRRFWVLRSIHWTRIFSITNDSSKSHGYHLQTARLRGTSSGRSICLYPVKMEDAPKLLKIPKSECPDIWIRLPRHKWPKSWSSMEDPVVPLERNLNGHPLTRLLWGKAIWENPSETRLGESFSLGMLIRTPWKGLFLSVYVYDIKLAGKKKTLIRFGNYSTKKSVWENQHLSLIMYTWDALKDNVK